jgi:hypothetical protein
MLSVSRLSGADGCPHCSCSHLHLVVCAPHSTLTLKAAGCGCPPDLVYFQAELYGREIDVLSCSNEDLNGGPALTDGPYKGTGFIRQGAIKYIQTREGLREAKGSVKEIDLNNGAVKVTDPLPELPLIKSGRLIIKLQEGFEY